MCVPVSLVGLLVFLSFHRTLSYHIIELAKYGVIWYLANAFVYIYKICVFRYT